MAFMVLRNGRFLALLLAGLLLPALAHAAQMLADTELQGKSYRSFELIAPVPDFCRKVCEKDSACKGWMFSWPGKKGKRAKCFLFSEVTEQHKDTCCIAGLRPKDSQREAPEVAQTGTDEDKSRAEETPQAAPAPEPARPATGKRVATAERKVEEPPAINERRPPSPPDTEEDALAEKRAFCTSYAETALEANRRARELGCGFRGGLWGASRRGYFNWCMRNSPAAARRNTLRRAQALKRCGRKVLVDRLRKEWWPRWLPWPEDVFPPWSEDVPDAYAPRRERPRHRALWRRAPFLTSWLKRSGPGPRSTPWRPSLSGKCVMVRACDCPQGNTCRVYEPGSVAITWPAGCDGPPAYYVCRVRRR